MDFGQSSLERLSQSTFLAREIEKTAVDDLDDLDEKFLEVLREIP